MHGCPMSPNTVSGTLALPNDANEHDVFVVTLTPTTSSGRVVWGIWADMVNIVGDGTFRLYAQIDGTNYRLFHTQLHLVASDPPGVYFDLNVAANITWRLTYQATVAEGGIKNIPYRYTYSG